MHFEILDKDKKFLFCTDYVCCIPDANVLNALHKRGCKFKISGNNATLSMVKSIKRGE